MLLNMMPLAMVLLQDDEGGAGSALAGFCGFIFAILAIVAMWRLFTKAGRPGWAAIIPLYNTIVLLQIVGRPVWWIILAFIPIVDLVIAYLVTQDLAKSFGKGFMFGLGLLLLSPIFLLMLAFSDARYVGPAAAG